MILSHAILSLMSFTLRSQFSSIALKLKETILAHIDAVCTTLTLVDQP